MLSEKSMKRQPPIYHITFEEYLQPRQPHKTNKLQFHAEHKVQNQKPELRLRLLEHPALFIDPPSKLRTFFEKCRNKISPTVTKVKTEELVEKAKEAAHSNSKTRKAAEKWQLRQKLARHARLPKFKLPAFLGFLRAREDDGLCKRKTGFEIYCEMASIHGFVNFVGAKTWQRVFWWLVICFAILMSTIILVMSYWLNIATPTILVVESTTHPAWTIAFPAVTICNLNRISRRRAEAVAHKLLPYTTRSSAEIKQHFRLALYNTDQLNATAADFRFLQMLLDRANYTMTQLLDEIAPNCESQLLRCKWKGRAERCDGFFRRIETPYGKCCSFNYYASRQKQRKLTLNSHGQPEQTTSCGHKTGLTVLLDPDGDDYMASSLKFHGYQILVHDAFQLADTSVKRHYAQARTETTIAITPRRTYAAEYLRGVPLQSRRCYLPQERQLRTAHTYSQANCLSECRSKMVFAKCGCVPPYWPRLQQNWTVCRAEQSVCVLGQRDVQELSSLPNQRYKMDRYAEKFICDCFPACGFNQYTTVMDNAVLDRTFSLGDRRFFKGIDLRNHILLHVYYGDLIAENLRMDIYENWLSFIGTFGGISGLYMGYSFVSGFELIFFTLVRPACNWLTKKQIRYRIKRRQKKAALTKKKLEEENQQQEQQTRAAEKQKEESKEEKQHKSVEVYEV